MTQTFASIGVGPTTVPELMPNRLVQGFDPDMKEVWLPSSHSVIVGTPVAVEPERAEDWTSDDDEGDQELPLKVEFDDPGASVRSWKVQVRVDELVAGESPSKALPDAVDGDLVTVRVLSYGGELDVDTYRAGLLAFGPSVWFLRAIPLAKDGAFQIPWEYGAVAQIDEDGALRFPFLSPDVRKAIKEETFTVDTLRRLGAEPTVKLEAREH